MIRALACLCVALLAAACGPLPAPFEQPRSTPGERSFLSMTAARGVAILPVTMAVLDGPGADVAGPAAGSVDLGAAVATAVADRLAEVEIPAEVVSGKTDLGFVLLGRVTALEEQGRTVRAHLFWDLRHAAGMRERVFEYDVSMDRIMWTGATEAALERLSRPVAEALTAHFFGSEGVGPDASVLLPQRPADHVLDGLAVRVALAEGPPVPMASLQLAMRETLARAGVRIVADPRRAEVAVVPQLDRVAENDSADRVTVTFRVERRDGVSVGQVALSNIVPRAELDAHWQGVAFLIAEAALPGVMEVLAESFDALGSDLPPPAVD